MIATRKSKLAAAAVAGTVLLGGGTAIFASAASGSPAGGTIHVFVNVDVKSETVNPIVITGAIGDYGTATSVDKNGKVDPNGNYENIKLKKGTFWVNGTALTAKANRTTPSINPATCSLSLSVSGPTQLFKGTGLYKGIGGTVKITESFGAVFSRLPSGACNEAGNPLSQGGSVTGVGRATF
jgi:hypothetical protein